MILAPFAMNSPLRKAIELWHSIHQGLLQSWCRITLSAIAKLRQPADPAKADGFACLRLGMTTST